MTPDQRGMPPVVGYVIRMSAQRRPLLLQGFAAQPDKFEAGLSYLLDRIEHTF